MLALFDLFWFLKPPYRFKRIIQAILVAPLFPLFIIHGVFLMVHHAQCLPLTSFIMASQALAHWVIELITNFRWVGSCINTFFSMTLVKCFVLFKWNWMPLYLEIQKKFFCWICPIMCLEFSLFDWCVVLVESLKKRSFNGKLETLFYHSNLFLTNVYVADPNLLG